LCDQALDHREFADGNELCDFVAGRLDAGDVVGWFKDRMEFGPRALGHRSILADPRRVESRRTINARTKKREGFRPFAPAVLAERAGEWFDLGVSSPYMLLVAPVRGASVPEALHAPTGSAVEPQLPFSERADLVASRIPACTHVDGSARVQTVDCESNPRFHQLLRAFEGLTGCPVLLNTSFNVAGEPVVATPEDALRTARNAGLDLLVIDDFIIEPEAWSGS
jgi:carbamoyltransferase